MVWNVDTEGCGQKTNTRFRDDSISTIAEDKLDGTSDQCISAARSTTTGTAADNCTATLAPVLRPCNQGRLDGKRIQGRPRWRWTDDIKEWSNRTVAECSWLARDEAISDLSNEEGRKHASKLLSNILAIRRYGRLHKLHINCHLTKYHLDNLDLNIS